MEFTIEQQREYRKRWLEALRSGEYQQAYGGLHQISEDGDRYCCLGVACKVLRDELNLEVSMSKTSGYDVLYNKHVGALPFDVWNALGLRDDVASLFTWDDNTRERRAATRPLIPDMELFSIANVNDTQQYTFSQIADIIEERASELFMEV